MAGSAAYNVWIRDGEPYEDAEPVHDLAVTFRSHGYTAWTKGDETHMQAIPPQDHTPFSSTGWPKKSAYPVGHALDIKNQDDPYPLWQIAEQIIRDKDAKYPGTECIKYINYTDKAGKCWHVSWQPDKATVSSTDKGHIHLSVRSDMDEVSTTYDPIKRLMEADMPDAKELMESDVVPNRPWRADGKPGADGVVPNPFVQWQFAITNTWDLAFSASETAKRCEVKIDKLTTMLEGLIALVGNAVPGTPGNIANLEEKVDAIAVEVTGITDTLANLTLKASGGSAPGI